MATVAALAEDGDGKSSPLLSNRPPNPDSLHPSIWPSEARWKKRDNGKVGEWEIHHCKGDEEVIISLRLSHFTPIHFFLVTQAAASDGRSAAVSAVARRAGTATTLGGGHGGLLVVQ